MKIDPYYQRQKCSPGILVSSKIIFMRIFALWGEFAGEGRQMRVGRFRFFRSLHLLNLQQQQPFIKK